MPFGEIAGVSGTLASTAELAVVPGQVLNAGFVDPGFVDPGFVAEGAGLAVVSGTVERSVVEAISGRSTAIGLRIKINGAWVPEAAIAGPVEIDDSTDTHRKAARFTLAGREWSVLRTLNTWTRVPVEIWFRQGRPGADLAETLEFRGWLTPGTRQSASQLEPVVTLQADDSSIYDDYQLCHEVEPYSGRTRGEIAAELAADVGLFDTSIPAGAIYNKPLFTDQSNLFAFLRDFGEPEGWHWRLAPHPTGPGHVLEAYGTAIKAPPQAPDHTWRLDDVDSIEITAPERPATRYVVRGLGAVIFSESGEQTEVTRVWVDGNTPPQVATHRQLDDGTVEPTGIPPITEEGLWRVSELETQHTTRGGKDLRQVVREWGWFAPSAARLVTSHYNGGGAVGAGLADDGFHFGLAYVLEDGSLVAWERERWTLVGERATWNEYDTLGRLAGITVQEARWHRKSRAVRENADPGPAPTLPLTGVGDDDQSWALVGEGLPYDQIETFGVAGRVKTRLLYGPASGAVVQELGSEYGWHSPRSTIDATQPYFVLYGGHGQRDLEAKFGLVAERAVNNLLNGGNLVGLIEWTNGWSARRVPEGTWDWGDSRSYVPIETFGQTDRKNTQYWRRPDGTVEEITLSSSKAPTSRIIARAPLPRYRLSPWTIFRQQPIEAVLDDETLEALFGFRREVLLMDHLLDPEEARRVAARRRRDDTSRTVTVQSFETLARPGDTVLLIDPVHGLHHRALLADRRRRRDLARPDAPATYTLRVPL